MLVLGILYGAVRGMLPEITDAMLDSAKEAVTLCISMVGVLSFWMGFLKIAECRGIVNALARRMKPVLRFLFPRLPDDHPACEHITTNIIANVLGLGWAATPAGLMAMEALSTDSRRASTEMCTFLIINISSLQLIPINIIAYRSEYGSVDPTAIVGPAILATICSTIVAVVFCKCMEGIETRRMGRCRS
jgi:spore maturation protein A